MNLPTGATVAVVDGEKLVMFHNTGHETVELSALALPDITPGTASRGHRSSAGNPDDDTQAEDGFAGGVAALLNKQALESQPTSFRSHWPLPSAPRCPSATHAAT